MRAGRGSSAAFAALVLAWSAFFAAAPAEAARPAPEDVVHKWYGLVLELVRHTPTYSPPVASRTFAYLGVISFEAVASGSAEMLSLAGQLRGLAAVPAREAGLPYDDAVVLDAALAVAVKTLFENTGPTGQRVMAAAERKWRAAATDGLPEDVAERSEAYGARWRAMFSIGRRRTAAPRSATWAFRLNTN
jgi:hypothetical protein